MFKAEIHRVEIEDRGEKAVFFIREASGREVLLDMAKSGDKKEPIDNARSNFKYVVREDGTALNKDETDALLDMRIGAMVKLNELVMEKSGLGKQPEGDAKKA